MHPKPPVQIQPQPTGQTHHQFQTQQQHHQQQQQQHPLQITMNHQGQPQLQMVTGTPTSQIIAQPQSTIHPSLPAHLIQQGTTVQQATRQLTILPHHQQQQQQQQQQQHHVQASQQLTTMQGQPQLATQQPLSIRPNLQIQVTAATVTSGANQIHVTVGNGTSSATVPNQQVQARAKVRKPTVSRTTAGTSPAGGQQKSMYTRAPTPTSTVNSMTANGKGQQSSVGTGITKVPISGTNSMASSNNSHAQPLKTINMSALQSVAPNLPDATLTPLPSSVGSQQSSSGQMQQHSGSNSSSVTTLPNPAISITPTGPPANACAASGGQSTGSQSSKKDDHRENGSTNGSASGGDNKNKL